MLIFGEKVRNERRAAVVRITDVNVAAEFHFCHFPPLNDACGYSLPHQSFYSVTNGSAAPDVVFMDYSLFFSPPSPASPIKLPSEEKRTNAAENEVKTDKQLKSGGGE